MKRYRLKKDLPTFKAGEVFVLWNTIETQGLCRESDDIMAYHQNTLDKFPNILEEWFEEIKPAEPLIKDEKIRKAVKAWAEANSILDDDKVEASTPTVDCAILTLTYGMTSIDIMINEETTLENHGRYTIDELCGEEEE